MRQKVVRKAVLFLASVALASVALGGVAAAQFQGFESDLSENSVVDVCNPDDLRPQRVALAIQRWNAVTAQWDNKPTLREVTGTGAFCEVTLEQWSDEGDQADFYARLEFGTHPDTLQISRRFRELTVEQRQAVITHEFGHALGLGHPPADEYHCLNSVMTNITDCHDLGVERTRMPGEYDEAELRKYWVEKPTAEQYPVKNKCWDSACSNWGPPPGSEVSPSSRDGGGGDRKAKTGGPPSAVKVPHMAIND
jgi:dual-action HEIGH metallo-peptidase